MTNFTISSLSSQKLQVFRPPHFQKETNFENANHGNSKKFDESGKTEGFLNVQDAISQEHREFLRSDGRGRRNLKH